MKPLLLMDLVGVNETVTEKAVRRGVALRAFLRRLRKAGMTTVCQVEARQLAGVTREEIARDLAIHLRDLAPLEQRVRRRREAQEASDRINKAMRAA